MKFQIIPVTPFQQNCSLLICEQSGKAAVVDPGGDIDLIVAAIEQQNVDLEKIFLTHGHLDHVGATEKLAALFNIPIEGPHHDDQFWLEALPSQAEMFNFPDAHAFAPTQWLKHGDKVTFGNQTMHVLHCPGHTPGHIVFYHPKAQLALVGDVLFKGSIGRTDFPRGNFDTLINSIKKQLWPLGKEVSFIPGHGPISTFGEEMRTNPFVAITENTRQ
jgi:glyoxylase-like metal-dependent hydrolase (beta-lactamase superfamily II)